MRMPAFTMSMPGHHLGDRVLDLHARVHLEEVEAPACGRPGTRRCPRRRSRPPSRPRPPRGPCSSRSLGGMPVGGRFLDHLLVAALDRALALAQVDRRCRASRRGSGSRCGAAPRRTSRGRSPSSPNADFASERARFSAGDELVLLAHEPHALAAAARAGLDHHRQADLAARTRLRLVVAESSRSCRARSARPPPACAGARSPCRPSRGSSAGSGPMKTSSRRRTPARSRRSRTGSRSRGGSASAPQRCAMSTMRAMSR